MAELVDNDGWENLIMLAESMGHAKLVERFKQALEDEKRHLRIIRELFNRLTLEDARVA